MQTIQQPARVEDTIPRGGVSRRNDSQTQRLKWGGDGGVVDSCTFQSRALLLFRDKGPHILTCQEPHTAALPQGSVEAALPCSCWSVHCSPLPPNPTERCLCNLMLFQKFMQDSFNSCTNPGTCLFPTRCDSYSVDTVQRRESSSWRSLEVSWFPVFESKAHPHRLFLHSDGVFLAVKEISRGQMRSVDSSPARSSRDMSKSTPAEAQSPYYLKDTCN
jgi:hypothetical protein